MLGKALGGRWQAGCKCPCPWVRQRHSPARRPCPGGRVCGGLAGPRTQLLRANADRGWDNSSWEKHSAGHVTTYHGCASCGVVHEATCAPELTVRNVAGGTSNAGCGYGKLPVPATRLRTHRLGGSRLPQGCMPLWVWPLLTLPQHSRPSERCVMRQRAPSAPLHERPITALQSPTFRRSKLLADMLLPTMSQ